MLLFLRVLVDITLLLLTIISLLACIAARSGASFTLSNFVYEVLPFTLGPLTGALTLPYPEEGIVGFLFNLAPEELYFLTARLAMSSSS